MTEFGSGTSFAIFGLMSIPMAGIGLKLRYNYAKQQQLEQHVQPPELLEDPYDQQQKLLEQHLQHEVQQQQQKKKGQLLLGSGEKLEASGKVGAAGPSAASGLMHRTRKGGAASLRPAPIVSSNHDSSSSSSDSERGKGIGGEDGDMMEVVLQPASLLFLWRAMLMGFGLGVMAT